MRFGGGKKGPLWDAFAVRPLDAVRVVKPYESWRRAPRRRVTSTAAPRVSRSITPGSGVTTHVVILPRSKAPETGRPSAPRAVTPPLHSKVATLNASRFWGTKKPPGKADAVESPRKTLQLPPNNGKKMPGSPNPGGSQTSTGSTGDPGAQMGSLAEQRSSKTPMNGGCPGTGWRLTVTPPIVALPRNGLGAKNKKKPGGNRNSSGGRVVPSIASSGSNS